mgnify:CR=1 FL=1
MGSSSWASVFVQGSLSPETLPVTPLMLAGCWLAFPGHVGAGRSLHSVAPHSGHPSAHSRHVGAQQQAQAQARSEATDSGGKGVNGRVGRVSHTCIVISRLAGQSLLKYRAGCVPVLAGAVAGRL